MRPFIVATASLLLATACERRDRFAAPDTTSATPIASLPPRSAYLSISDLSPKPGSTVLVAGSLSIGGDLTVGSYRVRLGYDSARLHFVEEVPSPGTMRVVNPRPGDVIVAGAAGGGAADGRLFTLRLRVDDPSAINSLVLRIDELTDTDFTDQKQTVTRASKLILDRTLGAPASSGTSSSAANLSSSLVTAAAVIDSISPRSGELENERVTDIILYGRGFAARGNLVLFGAARVTNLASEAAGTVLRFPAPSIRVQADRISVRVNNGAGESNAVTFIVKDGDR